MSAIPADLRRGASEWQRGLLSLGLVIVVALLIYRDTAAAMVGIWSRSDTFAHSFLVPPISLWLVWRRRHVLSDLRPRGEPWVLLPMALAALAWLLGDLAAVNAVTQLALVAMIVLAVPAVLGIHVGREITFPLAFLFFCVPIGEFLLPTLMEGTADFTVAALQATGLPVYREGLQFVIPSGRWSVVEACSGVRYLIASFMVGTLFGYLNFRSTRKRVVFMVVSLLVPVLANWLRAYMIVMIGHLSGNTLAVGVDHLIYGWLFFGVVISAMFMIGSRWTDPDDPPVSPDAAPRADDRGMRAGRSPVMVALTLVVLLMLPQAAVQALNHGYASARPPVLRLPDRLAQGAEAVAAAAGEWKPHYFGAAAEASRNYLSGGQPVGVYVVYYRAQSYQNKLVGSNNVVVPSRDPQWNRVETATHLVSVNRKAVPLLISQLVGNETHGRTERPLLTVMQVYWVNGQLTNSDHWAKVQGVLGRLQGRGDDAAAIFLYTAGDPKKEAIPRLDAFAAANLGAITETLQKTRAAR